MKTEKTEETHEKGISIRVNGQIKLVTDKELTFDQLVNLFFGDNPPGGPYEITYSHGRTSKPEGILVEGQSVPIIKGMVFNVRPTDKS